MKILELEIHCTRGITSLKIQPNGNNVVIYGPNGAGKSAVVDALDFLLTGKVSRLMGSGTSGITLSKHGPHIDYKPNDAIVSALVLFPGLVSPVKLSRCMANPSELVSDQGSNPKVLEKINEIVSLAEREQHVLTRREILRFITSEGATRAQQVEELLNVNNIEEIRKLFVRINNTIERSYAQSLHQLKNCQDNIRRTVGISKYEEDKILEFINTNRKILSGESLTNLTEDKIKSGLSISSSNEKPIINIDLLDKDIAQIKDLLKIQNSQSLIKEEFMLREKIKELKNDHALLHALSVIELTEKGIDLIDDSGKCPLCDKEWPQGELILYLRKKLTKGEKARKDKTEIVKLAGGIELKLQNLKTAIQRVIDQYEKVGEQLKPLVEWKVNIEVYINELIGSLEICKNPTDLTSDLSSLLSPKDIENYLDKLLNETKVKFPKASPQQTAWDKLTVIEVYLKELGEANKRFALSEKSLNKSTALLEVFTKSKDEVLNELYMEISGSFVELYKDLHGSDEMKFTAEMKPRGGSLDFYVDFHGRGNHPPHALHSEGHQDSMGLCLYLCMGNKLLGDLFELVILDDVVMSVDTAHRKELCKMLKKRYPKKQFIITTHDKAWATQLKHEGVVTHDNLIEFYDWRVETGPKVNKITDIWDQIEESLNKNDIPAAAHTLRRGSEEYFSEVCNSLQAKVTYKSSGQHDLGELLPAAISQLKKLLRKATVTARSWDNKEVEARLIEVNSTIDQTVRRSDMEQWNINLNVHYNNWVNFSSNDFRPVVQAFQDLFLLFKCTNCNSMLQLTKIGNGDANLKCNCEAISWNLQPNRNILTS